MPSAQGVLSVSIRRARVQLENEGMERVARAIAELHTALGRFMRPEDVTINNLADAATMVGVRVMLRLSENEKPPPA